MRVVLGRLKWRRMAMQQRQALSVGAVPAGVVSRLPALLGDVSPCPREAALRGGSGFPVAMQGCFWGPQSAELVLAAPSGIPPATEECELGKRRRFNTGCHAACLQATHLHSPWRSSRDMLKVGSYQLPCVRQPSVAITSLRAASCTRLLRLQSSLQTSRLPVAWKTPEE